MANEVALRPPENLGVIKLTPYEAQQYAKSFVAASMFASRGKDLTVDQAFTIITVGAEYGFGPGQSMVSMHLLDGKPELSADAQARFIKSSGKYDYRITEHTDEACEITVIAVPSGEIIGVERYTMADAERQELLRPSQSGRKTAWQKVPRNMLFARCVSNVCAFHCPDAVPMRSYAIGEIDGGTPEAQERELAPPPAPEVVAKAQQIEQSVAMPVPANRHDEEFIGAALVEAEEEIAAADVELEEARAELGLPPVEIATDDDAQRQIAFEIQQMTQRFITDSARLSDDDKAQIRRILQEKGLPFKTSNVVSLMRDKGFTDIVSYLSFNRPPQEDAPEPSGLTDEGYLSSGITGRETGSQTTQRTISDAQMRKFNAECGRAGLTAEERKQFLRFCGVESSRQLPADTFNDVLNHLLVIQDGGDGAKRLMLGGNEDNE